MLPIEYQNHVRAILFVAASQIKAKGRFRAGAVKRDARVRKAAAASAVISRAGAPYKKNQIEARVRGEIENACFTYLRRLHKELKSQGLAAVLPALGAVPLLAAIAPAAVGRRHLLLGLSCMVFVGLAPEKASAHHDRAWLAVQPDLMPFIASLRGELTAIITR